MIGHLRGSVAAITAETVIIDVGGVGYEVNGNTRLLHHLNAGEVVTLSIETIVREDFIRLYGFASAADRQCFRLLQSVQGVGARHALNILQVLSPHELYEAISAEDATAVSAAHGVGKKIAQRVVTELQSKLGSLANSDSGTEFARAAAQSIGTKTDNSGEDKGVNIAGVKADSVSALVNLGYDSVDARRAVSLVAQKIENPTVERLIPAALKELAP